MYQRAGLISGAFWETLWGHFLVGVATKWPQWSSGQQGKVREMEVWRGGRLWYWQPTHFSLQSQILPPSRLLPLVVNFCLLAGSELLGWSVYGFVWRVGLE